MEQINWLAILVAVIAQTAIGFIWYHPAVMGTYWAKANNLDVKDMQPKNPVMTYGITLIYTILFTLFLASNVTGPGQDVSPEGHSYATFQHGVAHAIALTIMVMLPVFGTPALFEKRGMNWVIVHVGYWFVRMAVAAGILSMWR